MVHFVADAASGVLGLEPRPAQSVYVLPWLSVPSLLSQLITRGCAEMRLRIRSGAKSEGS